MARRVAAPRGGVPFLHEKQIEAEAELLLGEYAEKFEPLTTADDLAALPEGDCDVLLNQKILVPSWPASHVTCDACHDDHVEEVTRIKVGKAVVFRIPCPAAGWVEVSEERFWQWTTDICRLVTLLSLATGSTHTPEEILRGIAWRLATIEIAGESYDVVFVRMDSTTQQESLHHLGRKHQDHQKARGPRPPSDGHDLVRFDIPLHSRPRDRMVDMMDKMLDQGLSPNPDEIGLQVDFRLTRCDGLEKPAQPSRSVLFFVGHTDRATRHANSELVLYDCRFCALTRWLGKGAK